jgi:RNA polymerase sigma factor (sigma-70 family)
MNKTEKEQLFRDIYTNYYHKISRISHGILIEKNSAEDLLQEIFLNIWHSLDKFQGKSSIGTWVYRVAVNSALVHNRRIKSYRREKDVFKQVTHENQTDTIPESNPELMKLKLQAQLQIFKWPFRIFILTLVISKNLLYLDILSDSELLTRWVFHAGASVFIVLVATTALQIRSKKFKKETLPLIQELQE